MRRLLLLALLFLLSPVPALAGARPAKPPPTCSVAGAAEARIDRIQARLDLWLERCVRLRGIAAGGRLYASREALVEPIRPNDAVPTGSIALYPTRVAAPPRKAAWVELVGRVGSCAAAHEMVERLSAEQPDQIVMVSGFCHTSIEAFVEPSAIRAAPDAEVDRLTEADVPEAKRQLVPIAESGARAKPYAAAAKALLAAIANGDEAGFRRLVAPMSQYELDQLGASPQPDWLREDLSSAHEAFVAARQDGRFAALGEAKLFVPRDALDEARPSALFACFCRTADCAGRWPVMPFDADSDPARPYLCVEAHEFLLGPGRPTVVAVDMNRPKLGFKEPRWQAVQPLRPTR